MKNQEIMFIAGKSTGGRLFWPPLISLNSVNENRIEQSLGDILPNFFKRVLFSISINLEPVFIEQIKNKTDEMLSEWSEVCSYIIGYIYNIHLLFEFLFCLKRVYLILSLTLVLGNLFLNSYVNIHADFVGNFLYTMIGSHMDVF